MINEKYAHKFCKDSITKIENYEIAKNDTTQTWDCHHRLELTLDGEFAHSREDLIRLGMYYDRPYFELIFLTKAEHQRLHNKGKHLSYKTRQMLSLVNKGKTRSTEARHKIADARKGKPLSMEHRQKLSEVMKGKHHTEESRKKMSESRKGKPKSEQTKAKMREAALRRAAKKREKAL